MNQYMYNRNSSPVLKRRRLDRTQNSSFSPLQLTSRKAVLLALCSLICWPSSSFSFSTPSVSTRRADFVNVQQKYQHFRTEPAPSWTSSTSALNAWWFGGTAQSERIDGDEDSCELVAVRIERTSANSRRIMGDITVPRPLKDVWAILTDYDRLAVHVPNLVESRIVSRSPFGEPGDGSFTCKLYQKGAQKIAGFEFGASVTMQMTEVMSRRPGLLPKAFSEQGTAIEQDINGVSFPNNERRITFKCSESMFFSQFDGEWKAVERPGPDGNLETLLTYVVDVRPKGPVPVTALEWRIREDVPTNLRAVKQAALHEGFEGVMKFREQRRPAASPSRGGLSRFNIKWDRDETMAAYIDKTAH